MQIGIEWMVALFGWAIAASGLCIELIRQVQKQRDVIDHLHDRLSSSPNSQDDS